jgi:transposase InsO family protein
MNQKQSNHESKEHIRINAVKKKKDLYNKLTEYQQKVMKPIMDEDPVIKAIYNKEHILNTKGVKDTKLNTTTIMNQIKEREKELKKNKEFQKLKITLKKLGERKVDIKDVIKPYIKILTNKIDGSLGITLDVRVGNEMQSITVMIDSGSPINICNKEMKEKFAKCLKTRPKAFKAEAVNKSTIELKEYLELQIYDEGKYKLTRFYVIEETPYTFIMGRCMMRSLGFMLIREKELLTFLNIANQQDDGQIIDIREKYYESVNYPIKSINNINIEELNNQQKINFGKFSNEKLQAIFLSILNEFKDIFAKDTYDMGTFPGSMKIKLKQNYRPYLEPIRRMTLQREKQYVEHLLQMENYGIIRRLTEEEIPEFIANGFLVKGGHKEMTQDGKQTITSKKGKDRVVTDYQWLNLWTVRNTYPLPNIEELFHLLSGYERYFNLDMVKSFFHIKIAEEDQVKTAFNTPLGLMCYQRCSNGLTNGPAELQWRLTEILNPIRIKRKSDKNPLQKLINNDIKDKPIEYLDKEGFIKELTKVMKKKQKNGKKNNNFIQPVIRESPEKDALASIQPVIIESPKKDALASNNQISSNNQIKNSKPNENIKAKNEAVSNKKENERSDINLYPNLQIPSDFQYLKLFNFLDDILANEKGPTEAQTELDLLWTLCETLKVLRVYGVKLNLAKCVFNKKSIEFLGRIINKLGNKPAPKHIDKILKCPVPINRDQLSSFLGLTNVFCHDIIGYSEMIAAFSKIRSVKNPYNWNEKHQATYELLKHKIEQIPMLHAPDFGPDAGRFWCFNDSSGTALGGALFQEVRIKSRRLDKGLKLNEEISSTSEKQINHKQLKETIDINKKEPATLMKQNNDEEVKEPATLMKQNNNEEVKEPAKLMKQNNNEEIKKPATLMKQRELIAFYCELCDKDFVKLPLKKQPDYIQHKCSKYNKIITRKLTKRDEKYIIIDNTKEIPAINNLKMAEEIANDDTYGLVPIQFNSSIVGSHMKHWHISELELMSIVNNNHKWEKLLIPRLFINVTDHLNLIEILNYSKLIYKSNSSTNSRLLRHATQLANFNFLTLYMPGNKPLMSLPDFLSRCIQHDIRLDPTLEKKLIELDEKLINPEYKKQEVPELENQINNHYIKAMNEKYKIQRSEEGKADILSEKRKADINMIRFEPEYWKRKIQQYTKLKLVNKSRTIKDDILSLNFVNLKDRIKQNPILKRQKEINKHKTRILDNHEKTRIIQHKLNNEIKILNNMLPTTELILNKLKKKQNIIINAIKQKDDNYYALDEIKIAKDGYLIKDRLNILRELINQKEITTKRFHQEQLKDTILNPIIRYLLTKEREWLEKIDIQYKDEAYQNQYQLRKDGILTFKENSNSVPKLVTPAALIMTLIHIIHEGILTNHNGTTRTIALISERFYWHGIQQDVNYFIAHCAPCQLIKINKVDKAYAINTTDPTECNEVISMDSVGPLPEGKDDKYSYYTTILDHFDNYLVIVPSKDIKAKTLMKILIENWILIYGPPINLITDNGSGYVAKLSKSIYKVFGTKSILTSPYNARANGRNEKTHQYINQILTIQRMSQSYYQTYQIYHLKGWSKLLQAIAFSYNCCPNRINKISPYELRFGRRPKLTIDNSLKQISQMQNKIKNININKYLSDLKRKLQVIQKQAKSNRLEYNKEKEKQAIKNNIKEQFEIDEEVCLKEYNSEKLESKWIPGYRIHKKENNGINYQVINIKTGQIFKEHIKNIRKYKKELHNKNHEDLKILLNEMQSDNTEDSN